MRHLSWGLAILAGLALGTVLVESVHGQEALPPPLRSAPPSDQPVVPRDTFAGRADFRPPGETAPEKKAQWGRGEAGACAIERPEITIRKNGTASLTGLVASGSTDDSYCVILDFFDQNQLHLYHFPRICSPTLGAIFAQWTNNNLAIPQHLYPFIAFATRQDHC
jgi:hypothetical protein